MAREQLGALADWTATDENLALVVNALRNDLQFRWSQWTSTEADRKRAQRGRAPKTPPLLEYAVRPPEVAAALAAVHEQADEKTAKPVVPGDRSGMRQMSIEQLARLV